MPITLGKDVTVNVGGTISSARSATFTETARTIDVEEFGSRVNSVYQTGYDATLSLEFNDSSDIGGMFAAIEAGDQVTVSGGAGGWSFPAVLTGISESASVDGVVTFTVEAKITRAGLR